MITKNIPASFNWNKDYPYSTEVETDREMTNQQRNKLLNYFYTRISNPEEVEERLQEIESFNYADAESVIREFQGSRYR